MVPQRNTDNTMDRKCVPEGSFKKNRDKKACFYLEIKRDCWKPYEKRGLREFDSHKTY